jgi:predicted acyl esterase
VQPGKRETRDGMQIDWDEPIPISDGLVLRADVFRPIREGRYAVILSYGPYAKGLHFEDGYPNEWRIMCEQHPDAVAGSTNRYANREVVDPEKGVPHGFACVRVDSRGAGRSPGHVQHFSPRETDDFYECIEWAGTQPWSNGKVGLSGISYYAMNQWHVASRQPPHLAAMCAWEGAADWYRDATHHGGILSSFWEHWSTYQAQPVAFGRGERGPKSRATGELVCGDETFSDEELACNRADLGEEVRSHPLIERYYDERSPNWEKITVPLLSAGNWGGCGLHLRGNTEGYVRPASAEKWLEMHGLDHWTQYYSDYGVDLQRRFFAHFLKGEENGWDREPRIQLHIRHVDASFTRRCEDKWPIPRTCWTKLHLDPAAGGLSFEPVAEEASVEYDALAEGVTFRTPPLERELEITGLVAAKLFASSSTEDADLFLILRVCDPQGREVTFEGSLDPYSPIGHGWLRASHRKLDPVLTRDYQPFHTHDELQPLIPGDVYELDVEIWPTCIVVPAGYTLALTVQGHDYQHGLEPVRLGWCSMTGVGPFKHDDPLDRPEDVFGGKVCLRAGGDRQAYVLLPVIPPKPT